MKLLKKIILVSYLKNKGWRRLLFIIGLIFYITGFVAYCDDRDYYTYNYKFNNIKELSEFPDYLPYDVLLKFYEKYPYSDKIVNSYKEWKDAFIEKDLYKSKSKYEVARMQESVCLYYYPELKPTFFTTYEITTDDYKYKSIVKRVGEKVDFSTMYKMDDIKEDYLDDYYSYLDEYSDKKILMKDFCKMRFNYIKQQFSLSAYDLIYDLKIVFYPLFLLYLPFLIACIIKWIFVGFKQK